MFYSKSLIISIYCNSEHFSDFNTFHSVCQSGKNKRTLGWEKKRTCFYLTVGESEADNDSRTWRKSQGKALKKLRHAFPLNAQTVKLPQKYTYFQRKEVLPLF